MEILLKIFLGILEITGIFVLLLFVALFWMFIAGEIIDKIKGLKNRNKIGGFGF